MKVLIDQESWDRGYADGLKGRPRSCPCGLDGRSYWSGVIEGQAKSSKDEIVSKEKRSE